MGFISYPILCSKCKNKMTKDELEDVLEKNKNTLLYCPWIQYTGKNQVRVDGPWRNNFKDRINYGLWQLQQEERIFP